MSADILALLEEDPAAGILAAADLREQGVESITEDGWWEMCRDRHVPHVVREASPAHALAAVRLWRAVAADLTDGFADPDWNIAKYVADEARAYVSGGAS